VVVAGVAAPAAGARTTPKFPKPPKFSLISAEVSVAVSGSLGEHASRDCGSCAVGTFLNGAFNAGFSSKVTWKGVPFVLSGSLPGIPSPDGYPAQDAITGTWSSSGQDFGGDGNPPTSFTCGGAVRDDPGNPSAGLQSLFDERLGGDHILSMTVAGDPAALGPDCDFPGAVSALMGNYQQNDNTQATGPFSGAVHVTQAEFGLPVIVKTITANHDSLPSADCTQWVSADHCSDTFNWTGTVRIEPNCEQLSTGPGYAGLSATMKAALGKLYAKLKSEKGCWHFTIGARSYTKQKDLYDRWHKLADHQQHNPDVCHDLNAAHLAQCPEGYTPGGIAKGGPAKPGTSRHESHEAADITVVFKPDLKENLGRYQAAASAAGLCGPPKSDPVHVELPHATKRDKAARCHFT
jgi:hypothetical protein